MCCCFIGKKIILINEMEFFSESDLEAFMGITGNLGLSLSKVCGPQNFNGVNIL